VAAGTLGGIVTIPIVLHLVSRFIMGQG
jgi:hypothetical protein